MLEIKLSPQAHRFLKKAGRRLAARVLMRIEKLAVLPFPHDVKRVVNKKEKVFRVRVGGYRIEYAVLYDQNLLYITHIDKRPRSY